jgi:sialate O-acetylesterase
MYYGMIAPLTSLQPTGVIWYQGESNVDAAAAYGQLLTALIKDWRTQFARDLPFIVVQLPNYGSMATGPAESGWATLRNAQQQVALHDPKVGIVVTQDLGDDTNIHPRLKYAVAECAVRVARALRGAGGAADGVVPRIVSSSGNSLRLEFLPPLSAGGGRDAGRRIHPLRQVDGRMRGHGCGAAR